MQKNTLYVHLPPRSRSSRLASPLYFAHRKFVSKLRKKTWNIDRGDAVRILKAGKQFGQKCWVMNPKLNGRIQVRMEKDGEITTFSRMELGPCQVGEKMPTWETGDQVRIIKKGTWFGATAVVTKPNDGEGGRVQVRMTDKGSEGRPESANIKTYKPNELEIFDTEVKNKPVWYKGDHVSVIKKGTWFGATAVVINPDWQGRVQVKMKKARTKDGKDASGDIKSYKPDELGSLYTPKTRG